MTPEVVQEMLDGIALGMHYEEVADLCGKGRNTIWRWMTSAERAVEDGTATEEQAEFWNAVKKAQAKGVHRRLNRIVEGDNGWQGSAWIQERRFRQKWGQTVKQEISGPNGGPVEIANMTPEQRATRMQEIVEAARVRPLPEKAE